MFPSHWTQIKDLVENNQVTLTFISSNLSIKVTYDFFVFWYFGENTYLHMAGKKSVYEVFDKTLSIISERNLILNILDKD